MFGVLILPLLFTGQLVIPELRSACPTTQVSGGRVSGEQIKCAINSGVSRLPYTFSAIIRYFKD